MKNVRYCLVLALLYTLYYLLPLKFRLLWQPDETRYAEISREMLQSGDWIVPHLLGLRYFEKPVAGYWINNISQWLFGHNNFGVRFGSVFSISITGLLIVWLTWRLWHDRTTSLLAVVIFLTSLLVYGIGTCAVLDPMITLWMALAMCSFWFAMQAQNRCSKIGGFVLLGAACGMGLMTKGFLALAVPVLGVLPWVIVQKRWKDVLVYGWLAVAVCILWVLPWGLIIAYREPDFWRYFFWIEHIQRFAEKNAQHNAPFWFYIPWLIAGSLPWLGLLPGALRRGWTDKDASRSGLYLLGWVVMPFLFFSVAKGKLPTYILPCFVPLAILMARYAREAAKTGAKALQVNGSINIGFGLLGLLIVAVCSPWGMLYEPVWTIHERYKCLLTVVIFATWGGVGWLARREKPCRWQLAALCPLVMALLFDLIVPEKIIHNKQPQQMTETFRRHLMQSRYVMTNSVGIASALAWELQRSDIIMFQQQGELRYGLSWPDADQSYIRLHDFSDWLANHRREGAVSLILTLKSGEGMADLPPLPEPDSARILGRFAYLQYLPQ